MSDDTASFITLVIRKFRISSWWEWDWGRWSVATPWTYNYQQVQWWCGYT